MKKTTYTDLNFVQVLIAFSSACAERWVGFWSSVKDSDCSRKGLNVIIFILQLEKQL